MIDPADVPKVESPELLARYIVQSSQWRPSDGTVKPDAFMPPLDGELSVTRHLLTTEVELWEVGQTVAGAQDKTLYGRGDVSAASFQAEGLVVLADPVESNPNHAHVTGWPNDKLQQKTKAQKIAAVARFVRFPLPSSE